MCFIEGPQRLASRTVPGLAYFESPIAASDLTLPFVLRPPASSKLVCENSHDDENDQDHHEHWMLRSIAVRWFFVQPWQCQAVLIRESLKACEAVYDFSEVVRVDCQHQHLAFAANPEWRARIAVKGQD
jgi:hypothetical protein